MGTKATAHYVGVWQLHGINKLGPDLDGEIVAKFDQPKLTARLTKNPESSFPHIDASRAIANSGINLLLGNSADDVYSEFDLETAVAKERAQRQKKLSNGIFLIIDTEATEQSLLPVLITENDSFHFCIEGPDTQLLSDDDKSYERVVITAIAASLPNRSCPEVTRIASAAYRVHPLTKKPIYSLEARFGPLRGILSNPLTTERFSTSQQLASMLATDKGLRGIANLLTSSFDRQQTNELQRFNLAWAALESFVEVAFNLYYKNRFDEISIEDEPEAAQATLRNLAEIGALLKRCPLKGQIAVVSAIINADKKNSDFNDFSKAYKIRNDLYHRGRSPEILPVEDIQQQCLRLIRLHLVHQERK